MDKKGKRDPKDKKRENPKIQSRHACVVPTEKTNQSVETKLVTTYMNGPGADRYTKIETISSSFSFFSFANSSLS